MVEIDDEKKGEREEHESKGAGAKGWSKLTAGRKASVRSTSPRERVRKDGRNRRRGDEKGGGLGHGPRS
eukprot:4013938-Pleurochrysis_carterae.AAC.2